MNGLLRIFLTVLISAAIAGVLSLFPAGGPLDAASDGKAVFRQAANSPLIEANLVDALAALPLHLKIRKADLEGSILSVDLSAVPGEATAGDVYRDLCVLEQFGRLGTPNVERVQVRVLEPAAGAKETAAGQLLIAMDARKQESAAKHAVSGADAAKEDIRSLREYLQTHTRLTFSSRWRDHFGL